MTIVVGGRDVDSVERAARARWTTAGRAKALAGLVVVAAVTAVLLGTAQTGPEGDPRLTNPYPSGGVLTDGYPRPARPLWGVTNWPAVFGLIMLGVALLVMSVFVVQSVRQRRASQGLLVFGCVMMMSLLEPIANWASFTVYDPRLLHFPPTWTWLRLNPSVEPLLAVPGYPFYFFTIALVACGVGSRWVLPRLKPGSWLRRHPRAALFGVGFLIAALWDVPTEPFMIRANMYAYSQSFGPRIHWGAHHAGLPLIWSLYTVLAIACITPFLHRDDDGGSLLTSAAAHLPRISKGSTNNQPSGQSAGRQVLAGGLVLVVIYLGITGAYAAIRVSGLAKNPLQGGWPYGEIKTYDPYGVLQHDGVPGPYYR